MIDVTLIGSGNVAHHLGLALLACKEIRLVQWYARDKRQIGNFAPQVAVTDRLSDLVTADLYLIAVSDDAIAGISAQLPFENRLVVHTSGSVPMNGIDAKNKRGVFYPLQTFSKTKDVDWGAVPICIESEHAADYPIVESVARQLSANLYKIDSKQRQALHVAAVFVSNFVNHLYQIGDSICQANGLSFDILKPLIGETADKILTLAPQQAQTGPARRGDQKTIARHLEFLSEPNQKKIYELLTHSIQNGQKL